MNVALSLVSHTNVGKTTLARTLLRRDIGEVRDEAHVTLEAERHPLIEVGDDRLELWDTPGFGDSVRLARRLAQARNPIGWFLLEVWDRWRDRAFWSSQRAVRHILNDADMVLYLVNAAEAPQDAAYLDAELSILDLIGKPVIVLLNQLGAPRPRS
jgi:GTPase Era involved in 16S rRNA processing